MSETYRMKNNSSGTCPSLPPCCLEKWACEPHTCARIMLAMLECVAICDPPSPEAEAGGCAPPLPWPLTRFLKVMQADNLPILSWWLVSEMGGGMGWLRERLRVRKTGMGLSKSKWERLPMCVCVCIHACVSVTVCKWKRSGEWELAIQLCNVI